jgi:N-acetylmuramoyl-L-alanine amidase
MLFLKIKMLIIIALSSGSIPYQDLQEIKPLQCMTICVDAGHGGQDQWNPCYVKDKYTGGTYGIITKQSESEVNLKVAIYLKQYLETFGAKVVMTRENSCRITCSKNKNEELSIRPKIANENNADIFISIHHNETKKQDINYGTVFYNNDEAKKMSDWTLFAISKQTGVEVKKSSKGNFTVLNHAKMPSILVEASFLSNPEEDCRLFSYAYDDCGYACWWRCQQEAYAIAQGLSMHILAQKTSTKISPYLIYDKFDTIKSKIINKSKKMLLTKKDTKKKTKHK